LPVPQNIVRSVHDLEIDRGVDLAQREMAKQGRPFKGFWYEAEMLEGDDVLRLEVNTRMGDPEAQSINWALHHGGLDLFALYHSAARGNLEFTQRDIESACGFAAVTLTMAAAGYGTGEPQTGDRIYGLDKDYGENIHIDLAGVAEEDGMYYTSGGRVLYVTAVGQTIKEARQAAYEVADNGINWLDKHVRRTIAAQAIWD
jgi:phosphoribosylamine--glycine ligase